MQSVEEYVEYIQNRIDRTALVDTTDFSVKVPIKFFLPLSNTLHNLGHRFFWVMQGKEIIFSFTWSQE